MNDQYKDNFETLLRELNSISHSNNEFNNLDFKYILRQRIIIINDHTGFDNATKNKIIQHLMMLGDRSNKDSYMLVLEDLYVPPTTHDVHRIKVDSSDDKVFYDPKHDYNITNDSPCTHFETNLKIYNKQQSCWYSCKNCYLDTNNKTPILEAFTHIKCDKCDYITKLKDYSSDGDILQGNCTRCDKPFAEYQCHSCLIFENDEENYMYHCPFCQECKLGEGLGIDYNHCKECDCCMPLEMFHNEEVSHRCIKNNLSSDCTICGVRLNAYQSYKRLDTQDTDVDEQTTKSFQNNGVRKRPIIDIDVGRVQFLVPCNHAIHETCLNEYLKNGQYKCPICQVTIVDMEINFKLLDEEIKQCPLPEPYNLWRCVYKCNDCTTRGMTSYHFLGIKCRCCFSFNTVLLQVLKHAEEKVEFIEKKSSNGFVDTKRSIVSKEMVDESFMTRKRANSEIKDNDMDDFLNNFLSKDEDLSISHVLQGLKQYYNRKGNDSDKKVREDGMADTDVNSMLNKLKFNVVDRFLTKKGTAETDADRQNGHDDGVSRQKTLFNDIGDSFKQFITFLEDSHDHNL